MHEGVEGAAAEQNPPRPGANRSMPTLARTAQDPPGEATHWTAITLFSRLTRRPSNAPCCARSSNLRAAINIVLAETDADPKPFVWTAHPDRVIAVVP